MEPNAMMPASATNPAPEGMLHRGGAAATLRPRMTARFIDGVSHGAEIGRHLGPDSRHLIGVLQRFTCIGPKAGSINETRPNGQQCRLRYIARTSDFPLADGVVERYGFGRRRLIVLRPEGQPGR